MKVGDFLRWWVGQLAACLPEALRESAANQPAGVVVTLTSPPGMAPATVEVTGPRRGRLAPQSKTVTLTGARSDDLRTALGPAGKTHVTLRLPRGMLLQRDVVLPIAAERATRQVLEYELDRLTPFRAEDMLWDFEIASRDRARGRLHLRLTFAPLAPLASLLSTLGSVGTVPGLLEADPSPAAPGQGRLRIKPHVPGQSRRGGGPRTAWAICAALGIAVVAFPFVRQSLVLGAIEARIDALRPAVIEAEALRHRTAAASAGDDIIQAERLRLGDPLRALAAATDALPDDTWVTDATLHQRKLTVTGQSQDAVRLIGRLSAEPALRNPSFTAPVTRSQAGRGDLFSIGMELQP